MTRRTPDLYAQALVSALHDAPKEKIHGMVKRFVALVGKHGESTRFPEILRAVEKREVARRGGRTVRVEFARSAPRTLEEKFTRAFHVRDNVTFTTRPELVAGVRLTVDDDRELDLSAKKLLQDLLPASK